MRRSASSTRTLAGAFVALLAIVILAGVALVAGACDVPLMSKSEVEVAPAKGDSSKALEDAIDGLKDGGTLRLQKGTYTLSEPLVIVKPVTIVGEGLEATRVVGASGESILEFNGHVSASVSGVGFERNGEVAGDVVDVVAADVTFDACAFAGGVAGAAAGGNGLGLFNDSTATVSGCLAVKNGRSGVHAQDDTQLTISATTCSQNGDAGIAFLGRAGGVAEKNICEKNTIDGIHVQDQCAPRLTANTCRKNKQTGILFIGTAKGMASKNKCLDNLDAGISVGGAARPEILTNTCSGNPYGIVYYDRAKGVARANTCKTEGTTDIGIAVFDDAKPKLVDNDSDNNLTATETV
jgi:parallel beta-helix repeat protein